MLDKFLTDKHLHWGAFRERKMGEGNINKISFFYKSGYLSSNL